MQKLNSDRIKFFHITILVNVTQNNSIGSFGACEKTMVNSIYLLNNLHKKNNKLYFKPNFIISMVWYTQVVDGIVFSGHM